MFKTHDSWQPFHGLPSLSLYDILLPFSPPATLNWTSGRKWMDRKIASTVPRLLYGCAVVLGVTITSTYYISVCVTEVASKL